MAEQNLNGPRLTAANLDRLNNEIAQVMQHAA